MTQTNDLQQANDKLTVQRVFAWVTLLPFPIWFLLGALLWTVFIAMANSSPNSGDALGWIAIAAAALYFPIYFILIFAAFLGVILSLTVLKKALTRFLNLLFWIDAVLVVVHVLFLAFYFIHGFITNMNVF